MPNKPALLILAAGIGSRYGGLKQIDPVGPHGEIVLDYSVYDAWRAGFGKFVFVVQPGVAETLNEHFSKRLPLSAELDFVFQQKDDLPESVADIPGERAKPWGTAHAVWSARNAIAEPFGVVNADDFYGADSYRLLAECLHKEAASERAALCMVAFRLRNTLSEHGTVSRGICAVRDDGLLSEVVERTKVEKNGSNALFLDADGRKYPISGDALASMNMWGFPPTILADIEREFEAFLRQQGNEPSAEFFMPTVVDSLIQRGRCQTRVLCSEADWFGMTYKEDRSAVETGIRRLIDAGVYPERLWAEQGV